MIPAPFTTSTMMTCYCRDSCVEVIPDQSAHDGLYNIYNLEAEDSDDYNDILLQVCEDAGRKLERIFEHDIRPVKAQIILYLSFFNDETDTSTVEDFESECQLLIYSDIKCHKNVKEDYLQSCINDIEISIHRYEVRHSDWTFGKFVNATLQTARYYPMQHLDSCESESDYESE